MARQVSKAKQQLLRIGFVPIAEMKIFPYVLPNLRLQHPDLTIELSSLNNAEQLKALKRGELDITFTRDNTENDEIQSQFVLTEPLIFYYQETIHLRNMTVFRSKLCMVLILLFRQLNNLIHYTIQF